MTAVGLNVEKKEFLNTLSPSGIATIEVPLCILELITLALHERVSSFASLNA